MVESKSAWRSSRPSKRRLCPQLEPHRDPSSPRSPLSADRLSTTWILHRWHGALVRHWGCDGLTYTAFLCACFPFTFAHRARCAAAIFFRAALLIRRAGLEARSGLACALGFIFPCAQRVFSSRDSSCERRRSCGRASSEWLLPLVDGLPSCARLNPDLRLPRWLGRCGRAPI